MKVGAYYDCGGRCLFVVLAPLKGKMELKILSPHERVIPMERQCQEGYWMVHVKDIAPGVTYLYRIDGKVDRPDPASGCTRTLRGRGPLKLYLGGDNKWRVTRIDEMVVYEPHVGTFTNEGTFRAVIEPLGGRLLTSMEP